MRFRKEVRSMAPNSIAAYEVAQRVASYDSDMEIMHPNRAKMVQVALDILPFSPQQPLCALELGVGTGYFAESFLRRYPHAHLWAIDGAAAMLDMARARLGPLAERVRFLVGDFRDLARLLPPGESFDVTFSSFALHHLDRDDKQAVVRQARTFSSPTRRKSNNASRRSASAASCSARRRSMPASPMPRPRAASWIVWRRRTGISP
jgi:ubiquinone/menaquinone biosynthesis C-methylase UbiE